MIRHSTSLKHSGRLWFEQLYPFRMNTSRNQRSNEGHEVMPIPLDQMGTFPLQLSLQALETMHCTLLQRPPTWQQVHSDIVDAKDSQCNLADIPYNLDLQEWQKVREGLQRTTWNCLETSCKEVWCIYECMRNSVNDQESALLHSRPLEEILNWMKSHLDAFLATAKVILEQNIDPG